MNTPYPAEVPTVTMIMAEIAICFPARAEAAQNLLDRALAIRTDPRDADYPQQAATRNNLLRQAWVITL